MVSDNRVATAYTSTGALGPYQITWTFEHASDVYVAIDGVPLAGFTVTRNPNGTGSVMLAAAPAVDAIVTVGRATPVLQPLALPVGGPLPSAALESVLDRVFRVLQEHRADLNNLLGIPNDAIAVAGGTLQQQLEGAAIVANATEREALAPRQKGQLLVQADLVGTGASALYVGNSAGAGDWGRALYGPDGPVGPVGPTGPAGPVGPASDSLAGALARVQLSFESTVERDPRDVSGLLAYLYPGSGYTISSGTSISQWTDASGLGNHATQATSGLQPKTESITLNGTSTSCLRFGWNGSSSSQLGLPSLPMRTIIAVVKRYDGTGALSGWVSNNNLFLNTAQHNPGSWNYSNAQIIGSGGGYMVGHSRREYAANAADIGVHSFTWHGTEFPSVNGVAASPWSVYSESWNLMATTRKWSTSRTFTDPFVLGTTSGSQYLNGYVVAVAVYDRVLTVKERQSVERFLGKKYGVNFTPFPGRNNVLVVSNSIGAGGTYSGQTFEWVYAMGAALDESSPSVQSRFHVHNASVGGANLLDIIARVQGQQFPVIDPAAAANLAILWEGTNDLSVRNETQAHDNFRTAALLLRNAGWQVMACDTFSATAGQRPDPWEARRVAYNALMAANWTSYADFFVQPSTWTEFQPRGTNLVDGLHPSPAGGDILRDKFAAEVRRCIGRNT